MNQLINYTVVGGIALIIGIVVAPHNNIDNEEMVRKVCDYSRGIIDTDVEEACGALQASTDVQYLCDGVEAESSCWTIKE